MVRDLTATKETGINRVQWDLRGKSLVQAGGAGQGGRGRRSRRDPGNGGRACGGTCGRRRRARSSSSALVDPGEYVARLTVNGRELTTAVRVEPDPEVTVPAKTFRLLPVR